MRKTSAYARKIRRVGQTYNGAEWLNTMTKCRPYDEEMLPGSIATEPSFTAVRKAIVDVRTSFELIKDGIGSERAWDFLAHATGITKVRSIQIAGDGNEMLEPLHVADAALEKCKNRYLKWNKWELLPQEVADISYALDIYEEVATASSPAQMSSAMQVREQIIERQRRQA